MLNLLLKNSSLHVKVCLYWSLFFTVDTLPLFNPLLSASSRAILENQERAVGRKIFGMCVGKLAAVMGRYSLVNAQDFQKRVLFDKKKYRQHVLHECS